VCANANGNWTVTNTGSSTFTLNTSTGTCTYTSGGTFTITKSTGMSTTCVSCSSGGTGGTVTVSSSTGIIGRMSARSATSIASLQNTCAPVSGNTTCGFVANAPVTIFNVPASNQLGFVGAIKVQCVAGMTGCPGTVGSDNEIIFEQNANNVGNTIGVSAMTGSSVLIQITCAATKCAPSTGSRVVVSGSTGNTAANGTWTVTNVSGTTFTLNGSTGNGSYINGASFVEVADASGTAAGSNNISLGLYQLASDGEVITGETEGGSNPITGGFGSGFRTGNPISILTSSPSSVNGPEVSHLVFEDLNNAGSSSGYALTAITLLADNSFSIHDNLFLRFNATGGNSAITSGCDASQQGGTITAPGAGCANGYFAGTGVILTGGTSQPNPQNWTQFGQIYNNHYNDDRIGIMTMYKVSSILALANYFNCYSTADQNILDQSLGFDLGWSFWFNTPQLGASNGTGGENVLLQNQVQGCLVGFGLGANGSGTRLIANKSEMSPPMTNINTCQLNASGTTGRCSIGVSVIRGSNVGIDQQTVLKYDTGFHLDPSVKYWAISDPMIFQIECNTTNPCVPTQTVNTDVFSNQGSNGSASSYTDAAIWVESAALPFGSATGIVHGASGTTNDWGSSTASQPYYNYIQSGFTMTGATSGSVNVVSAAAAGTHTVTLGGTPTMTLGTNGSEAGALVIAPNGAATPTVEGTVEWDGSLLMPVLGSNSTTFVSPKTSSVSVAPGGNSVYDCISGAAVTGCTTAQGSGNTETAYATTYSIPANELINNKTIRLTFNLQTVGVASGTAPTFTVRQATCTAGATCTSGTILATIVGVAQTTGTLSGQVVLILQGTDVAGSGKNVTVNGIGEINGTSRSNVVAPVSLTTSSSITIQPTMKYAGTATTTEVQLTGILVEYF
jgi:hypothetical protein